MKKEICFNLNVLPMIFITILLIKLTGNDNKKKKRPLSLIKSVAQTCLNVKVVTKTEFFFLLFLIVCAFF